MGSLINDLLEYSRVGRSEVKFADVDCNDVMEKITLNLAPRIAEVGATVKWGSLPVVKAVTNSFIQLFQNLIENAIKFRGAHAPIVKVSANKQGPEWIFCVKDNGIGMDPQFKDRIFIIFQRLHGHDKYPGTGMGLSICKKIVELHGGKIWVESEPGKGSSFYFTIPA
jgi:light-regulated signal transduction histidine kinase (bacteriophytochrome)